MAERRMFAKTIIDSDAFLEMPQSTQLLYFHLSMRADDDGFINKPRAIMRVVGCKEDDLKILAAKKFIIPFESGIVVIKHWKIHNYIAKDRYTETKYKEEKATLGLDENGSYTNRIQIVDDCATQVSLGKGREGEDRVDTIEAGCDNESKRSKANKPSNKYEADFDSFWSLYPRKKNKDQAMKTYNGKRDSGITHDHVIECLTNYLAEIKARNTDIQYVKYAASFLNNMEDYAVAEPISPSHSSSPSNSCRSTASFTNVVQ